MVNHSVHIQETIPKAKSRTAALTLGAIGVVYGDIGTSPLYALRESVAIAGKDGLSAEEVVGVVSLLIWSLILIVTVKYVIFLMRADNKGEGGILSLVALVRPFMRSSLMTVTMLGMVGAALFSADAVLTPAISVLSAVEGLNLVAPSVGRYVLPITLVILVTLFVIQRHGTERVARMFGPIMLIWFLALAGMAIPFIFKCPEILHSLLPWHAAHFLMEHRLISAAVLGAVFLAVTGGEALYADMGHFGKTPIRLAWIFLVFPSLALNYLGQGALIILEPEAANDPFFYLAPAGAMLPLVILATLATIIASQAVITGAFSMTQQAVQLGILPRFEIRHTSSSESGQIYLPRINFLLAVGVLYLVLVFKSSSALASAYGLAVAGTMLITTLLATVAIRHIGKKSLPVTLLLASPFFVIDMMFFSSNMLKIPQGGYVPLLIGLGIVILMFCWVRGMQKMQAKEARISMPLDEFLGMISTQHIPTIKGTAVFLTQDPTVAPTGLMHNIKHNKVLHEQNIILSIVTEPMPRVPDDARVEIREILPQFVAVKLRFGFMETPNVAKALMQCRKHGMKFDIMSTSFFLSRRMVRTSSQDPFSYWADKIYIILSRNAARPSDFFHIPTDRVVELGTQVTM